MEMLNFACINKFSFFSFDFYAMSIYPMVHNGRKKNDITYPKGNEAFTHQLTTHFCSYLERLFPDLIPISCLLSYHSRRLLFSFLERKSAAVTFSKSLFCLLQFFSPECEIFHFRKILCKLVLHRNNHKIFNEKNV